MIRFNLSRGKELIRHQRHEIIKSWKKTDKVKFENELDLMLTLNQNLNCPEESCELLIDAFLIAERETVPIIRRNSKIRICPFFHSYKNSKEIVVKWKRNSGRSKRIRTEKITWSNSEMQNGFSTKENSVL